MGWRRAIVIGVASAFLPAALGVATVLLLAGPATAQEAAVKIKGRVLDGEGHPLEGAEVASMWSVNEKDGRQGGFNGATTDAEGRFVLKTNFYGRDAALMAIDSARKVGGTAVVQAKDASREAEIRVAPLVRVHGKLASSALGRAPGWTNVYMNLMPGRLRLLQNSSEKAEFSMARSLASRSGSTRVRSGRPG